MASPPLTIRLFGPLRVTVCGEPLPRVRTRSVEWLLALLTLRHGRAVSRAWLAGTLWPDSSESRALQNLREDLVRLRKALGPEAARIQSPSRDSLTLDLGGAEVDVIEFDRGVEAEDEVSLRAAVALYTGPLLEGCVEEWVLVERETRAEQCLRALEALGERAEARGDHSEAIGYLRRAEALDPLRDSLQRRLMRILAASGDLPAALLTYREHRLRLHREMSLEPDVETQALFRQLRAEARSRAGSRFQVPGSRLERPDRPVPNMEHGTWNLERPSGEPSRLPQPLTQLIGRVEEVQEITARIPVSRLVTLVGGGGVGKTRLALQAGAAIAAGPVPGTDLAEAYPGRVLFVELAPLADPTLLPTFVAGALGLHEAGEPRFGAEGDSGGGRAPGGTGSVGSKQSAVGSREGASERPTADCRLPTGLAALTRWLAWEPSLLVLDNCEHLLPAVAELAQNLLQACPELRLLATSRRRLGLTGEVVWRVPSLPAPDPEQLPEEGASAVKYVLQFPAAQLFVERAMMARPGFRLRQREEAIAMARICQRLDGVPLALELAAVRVTVLPVAQIAARLDHRFQLLTGGSAAVLPRHRTLRALIDWSYDSLTAPQAALLRRLSVFAGGWTLAGAEEVLGAERHMAALTTQHSAPSTQHPAPDVLDLLDALEACSLVLVEEGPEGLRYRMLETVREYARERLRECGEEAMTRAAHVTYCLELAETAEAAMHGPEPLVWLDRLEIEHANLRAALAWCLEPSGDVEAGLRLARAMHSLWADRSYRAMEGRQYLELLLASPQAAGRTAARAAALHTAAELAVIQGDYTAARVQGQESLAISEELDDPRGIAHALLFMSRLTRDSDEAQRLVMRSLALLRESNDAAGVAYALTRLAQIARMARDYDAAGRLHHDALAMARSTGDPILEAHYLAGLGSFEWLRREYAAAREHFQGSLTLARGLGMPHAVANSLYYLGCLAFQDGDHAAAQALWEECRGVERRNRTRGGPVLGRLAEVATLRGDTATARARWEESLAEARELGRQDVVAFALLGLGNVARLEGDAAGERARYAESLRTIQAALRPVNRTADQRHEDICAVCLRETAAAMRRSGRDEPAARLLAAAGALVEAAGLDLSVTIQAEFEEQLATLRAVMGEEPFAAAWDEGRAMAPEQAVQYALDAVRSG